MLVLFGKGASGKDTVLDKLCSSYSFRKIITYTTRPPRKGEKDGVTYHFITKEEFEEKIRGDFFAEYATYTVADGSVWYYGSSIEDIEDASEKDAIILTPNGVRNIKNKIKNLNCKIIYVYANEDTIRKRMAKRKDKEENARRIEHDRADFKGVEELADRIFYNNNGQDIDELCEKIAKYCD